MPSCLFAWLTASMAFCLPFLLCCRLYTFFSVSSRGSSSLHVIHCWENSWYSFLLYIKKNCIAAAMILHLYVFHNFFRSIFFWTLFIFLLLVIQWACIIMHFRVYGICVYFGFDLMCLIFCRFFRKKSFNFY